MLLTMEVWYMALYSRQSEIRDSAVQPEEQPVDEIHQ